MNTQGNRPTLGGMVLQHFIVFLICVVFPGLVTMMAPATWITLSRGADSVRCTTRTCAFFVVPFRIQQVDSVTEIEQRERAGKVKKQVKMGRTTDKKINVDGEGFLEILGAGEQKAEVSVSPASLESVLAKAKDFLGATQPSSTTLFAIANWKFGGLMGGILTSLTLLYVVGYTLKLVQLLFKGLTSSKPVSNASGT